MIQQQIYRAASSGEVAHCLCVDFQSCIKLTAKLLKKKQRAFQPLLLNCRSGISHKPIAWKPVSSIDPCNLLFVPLECRGRKVLTWFGTSCRGNKNCYFWKTLLLTVFFQANFSEKVLCVQKILSVSGAKVSCECVYVCVCVGEKAWVSYPLSVNRNSRCVMCTSQRGMLYRWAREREIPYTLSSNVLDKQIERTD